MGSSSWSQTTSNTSYTNTPVTQDNVTNPINLTNSNANMGYQVGGALSVNNVLDAGAVNSAFDFGSKLVQVMADVTRQNNAAASAQSAAETKAAVVEAKQAAAGAAALDLSKYSTAFYVGAAIIAWMIWRHKS